MGVLRCLSLKRVPSFPNRSCLRYENTVLNSGIQILPEKSTALTLCAPSSPTSGSGSDLGFAVPSWLLLLKTSINEAAQKLFVHQAKRSLSTLDAEQSQCKTCNEFFTSIYFARIHEIVYGHDNGHGHSSAQEGQGKNFIPPWMFRVDEAGKIKYEFLCARKGCNLSTGTPISMINMLHHIKAVHVRHLVCPFCLYASENKAEAIKHQEDWCHSERPRKTEELIQIYRRKYNSK